MTIPINRSVYSDDNW